MRRLLLTLLCFATASTVAAQDVSLTWHAPQSNDPTWHDPREIALRGSYPIWRFIHVMAGYSAASSTGHRLGTYCVGMAPPGYVCPLPEDLTDFGRFRTRSIGLGVSVVRRADVDLRVVGLMHWVRGRSRTETVAGIEVLSATQ